MKIVYSPRYSFSLGAHVFPILKYRLIRDVLARHGVVAPDDWVEPAPAEWDELALVHTPDYLAKVRTGRLSHEEIAELELPWSRELVEGFRLMAGGTIAAARLAVMGLSENGRGRPWSVVTHLGGGFHHAFCNHGEGFCLFNDVAVAIRVLKRARLITRAAIVDCDVHHGNGTASIFTGEPNVLTFSMHQLHNYPAFKPAGWLDIDLADGTGDQEYLAALRGALPKVFSRLPDIVFYLAGADPYREDQLGGLAMTKEGLERRDRMVLRAARDAGVPVVVTLAGGYARRVEDTVAIHAATVETARKLEAGVE